MIRRNEMQMFFINKIYYCECFLRMHHFSAYKRRFTCISRNQFSDEFFLLVAASNVAACRKSQFCKKNDG